MSFSVRQVLEWVGGRLVNEEDVGREALDAIRVERPAPLGTSQPNEMGFFFSRAFEGELPSANPGVLITGEPFVRPLKAAGLKFWRTGAVVSCPDPYGAMATLSEKFASILTTVAHLPVKDQGLEDRESFRAVIHPSAVVDSTVVLGDGVRIGAQCVVEKGTRIGNRTILYPGCFVGPGCNLGDDTVLFPRVTVYESTQVGSRVRLHAGVVLGSDGFGYAPHREGGVMLEHQKIYHLGQVVIEDDVEIGANSCVDRATFGQTRIGKGSKLDNLVHMGHNSTVGEGAIICGGTCLAGNAVLGKFVTVGGLTGITNHVHVQDGASVGALTLVTKDVEKGGTAVGNPQRDYREHFKAHALLSRLLTDRRSK